MYDPNCSVEAIIKNSSFPHEKPKFRMEEVWQTVGGTSLNHDICRTVREMSLILR